MSDVVIQCCHRRKTTGASNVASWGVDTRDGSNLYAIVACSFLGGMASVDLTAAASWQRIRSGATGTPTTDSGFDVYQWLAAPTQIGGSSGDQLAATFSAAGKSDVYLLELDATASVIDVLGSIVIGSTAAPLFTGTTTVIGDLVLTIQTTRNTKGFQITPAFDDVTPVAITSGDANPSPVLGTTADTSAISIAVCRAKSLVPRGAYSLDGLTTGDGLARTMQSMVLAIKVVGADVVNAGPVSLDTACRMDLDVILVGGPDQAYHRVVDTFRWPSDATGTPVIDVVSPAVSLDAIISLGQTQATILGTASGGTARTALSLLLGTALAGDGSILSPVTHATVPSEVADHATTPLASVLSGLVPATTYYAQVVGLQDGTGLSAQSLVEAFTTTTLVVTGPPIPTLDGAGAGAITQTTATLRGVCDANGLSTAYHWSYTVNGGSAITTTPVTLASTTAGAVQRADQAITGLPAGASIVATLIASNSAGTVTASGTQAFTTTAAVASPVITLDSPLVASNSPLTPQLADIHAKITTTAAMGDTTVTIDLADAAYYASNGGYDAGLQLSGTLTAGNRSAVSIFNRFTTLAPATTYHTRYTITRVDGLGTPSITSDATFTTASPQMPTATLADPTSNGTVSEILNMLIGNADGLPCIFRFAYGLTSAYEIGVTIDQAVTPASSSEAVTQTLSGLSSSTSYHYRGEAVRADGLGGVVTSIDGTFTTQSTLNPAEDPDSPGFAPGDYSTWFPKFVKPGSAFVPDAAAIPAATRSVYGGVGYKMEDLTVSATTKTIAGLVRRVYFPIAGTSVDLACPFKSTGDVPPINLTSTQTLIMADGTKYITYAASDTAPLGLGFARGGRTIRLNPDATITEVTGYIIIHGLTLVGCGFAATGTDTGVWQDLTGNINVAPSNVQVINRAQFLGSDLSTYGSIAPIDMVGGATSRAITSAIFPMTVDGTGNPLASDTNPDSINFQQVNVKARNIHSAFCRAGGSQDAGLFMMWPSTFGKGLTDWGRTGQIQLQVTGVKGTGATLSPAITAGTYALSRATPITLPLTGAPAGADFAGGGGFFMLRDKAGKTGFDRLLSYTSVSGSSLLGVRTVENSPLQGAACDFSITSDGTSAVYKLVPCVQATTTAISLPLTAQKMQDALNALGTIAINNGDGLSQACVVGLENQGPWGIGFTIGGSDWTNANLLNVTVVPGTAGNTPKDSAGTTVTYAGERTPGLLTNVLNYRQSMYGVHGNLGNNHGNSGEWTRCHFECRFGDGIKIGGGCLDLSYSYYSFTLNPERFSTPTAGGHVDDFQVIGTDSNGNQAGCDNRRSGRYLLHAGLHLNAGNTALFVDGLNTDSNQQVVGDRVLCVGVNKFVALNGCSGSGMVRGYAGRKGDAWFAAYWAHVTSGTKDPRFSHVTDLRIPRTLFSASPLAIGNENWSIGFEGNPHVAPTTFKLRITSTNGVVYTTTDITYSAVLATLKTNIQTAVNAALVAALGSSDHPDQAMFPVTVSNPSDGKFDAGLTFGVTTGSAIKLGDCAVKTITMLDLAPTTSNYIITNVHPLPNGIVWPEAPSPLVNYEVAPGGTLTPDDMTANQRKLFGCSPPLAPDRAGKTTGFTIPSTAITVVSSADFITRFQSASTVVLRVPAGMNLTNTGPVTVGAVGTRVYFDNSVVGSEPTIDFGLSINQPGVEIHGLKGAYVGTTKLVNESGTPAGPFHAVLFWGAATDWKLADATMTPGAPIRGYGVGVRNPLRGEIERCLVDAFELGSFLIPAPSNDPTTSFYLSKFQDNTGTGAFIAGTLRGSGDGVRTPVGVGQGTAEFGLWIGVPIYQDATSWPGLNRCVFKNTGWGGVNIIDAAAGTLYTSLRVDDVFGMGDDTTEAGTGVYLSHYSGAGRPAPSADSLPAPSGYGPLVPAATDLLGALLGRAGNSFYHCWVGPNLRRGMNAEWYGPASPPNPAGWNTLVMPGWWAATRTTLMAGASVGINAFTAYLDKGTQRTYFSQVLLAGNPPNAGHVHIADHGGFWVWNTTTGGTYVDASSAGTSSTDVSNQPAPAAGVLRGFGL